MLGQGEASRKKPEQEGLVRELLEKRRMGIGSKMKLWIRPLSSAFLGC